MPGTPFEVRLDLAVLAGGEDIDQVQVGLMIRNDAGGDAGALFDIGVSVVDGMSGIAGDGALSAGSSAAVRWIVTPLDGAAPDSAQSYQMGGGLGFSRAGAPESVTLFPARVTVVPVPEVDEALFYPAHVYADDPLTEASEAAEPFVVAVMLHNQGPSAAQDMTVRVVDTLLTEVGSGEPNAFQLLRAQSGADAVSAQFAVLLGDISIGQRTAILWEMSPALSGDVASVVPSYYIEAPDTGLRTLLPTASVTHDLARVVMVDAPADDGLPDFLVNDVPDADSLPDTIHSSTGDVLTVTAAANATLEVSKQGRPTYVLTATMASGWSYVYAANPVPAAYVVESVQRSDSTFVDAANVWLTHRTVRDGGEPVEEHLLHLLDYNGSGNYTVVFQPSGLANTQPEADAAADQSAYLGDVIVLDGTGSSDFEEDPLTYQWAFTTRPAGSSAVLDNPASATPSFTADVRGEYVLELVVNDGELDSEPDAVTVDVVNRVPVAGAGPGQSRAVGQLVTLDGSASADLDGDILAFSWAFVQRPAGSAAALDDPNSVTPHFTIDIAGDYIVELVVDDGFAASVPDSVTISTENTAPVADAGVDQTGHANTQVTLDGSGSFDVDDDELTFSWSFVSRPAGSAAALENANTVTPWFTIDVPGGYVVQLVVNDGIVSSAPDTVTVSTENSAPVANAGPDRTAQVGDTVSLDGSGSSDIDNDALSFTWTIVSRPSASTASLSSRNVVRPTVLIDEAGAYVFRLVVNDGSVDSAPDTITISTVNTSPVANAGADQGRCVGDAVTLDGSGSSDVDDDELEFSWSFTSRPAGSSAALANAGSVSPSFTLDKAGDYVLRLIVSDGSALSEPDSVTVSTQNTAPVANAGLDQTVQAGATATVSGSGSSDVDNDELTFAWSFTSRPSGSTAALDAPTQVTSRFTVDVAGDYVLQLVVNDGRANSAPDTVTVSTENSPPVADAGPAQTRRIGQEVQLDGSGSSDANNDPLQFRWSFTSRPQGSTTTIQDANTVHPRFLVDAPGSFVIQLIVNDGAADSAPDTVTISTENSAPTANAGPDQTREAGNLVTLDGSASSDPDNDELTFRWGFLSRPEGSETALSSRTALAPTFTIDVSGTYVVQLVVNDGTKDSAPDTVTISTENSPPVADAGADIAATLYDVITLDGSASYDVDGQELVYSWSFTARPAASITTLDNPVAVRPSFTVDVGGSYVVQLIVSDGVLYGTPDTVTISTENSPPVANAGADQTRLPGQLATLDGTESYDPDRDILGYSWSFTSRPEGSTVALSNANTSRASFRIDVKGSYVAQLLVSDGILSSGPDTVVITTLNSPPVARAGFDQSVPVGGLVRLDGASSYDPDGEELAYRWSLSSIPPGSAVTLDAATAALAQPTFVADAEGDFIVQLIVNDGQIDSNPDTMTVFSGGAAQPCANPPAAPQNVAASDGTYVDRVEVAWQAVDGATEYRLWRSGTDDVATAVAISNWIGARVYNDTTAPAATVEQGQGCACQEPAITLNYQYYWVEARSNAECVSEKSVYDRGHRAAPASKAAPLAGTVAVEALPAKSLNIFTRVANENSALFVRLRSASEDILDVWGVVLASDLATENVVWVPMAPDGARDGWVAYYPGQPWTAGDVIDMTVGGITVSGAELGPVSYSFEVWPGEAPGTELWQPAYADLGTGAMDLEAESNDVVDLAVVPEDEGPCLADAYTPAYRVGPDEGFAVPQRVWLPLPEGVSAEDVTLYYYYEDGRVNSWYPAEQVAGWLIEDSYLTVALDGTAYLGVLVTHGGLIQLAPAEAVRRWWTPAAMIRLPGRGRYGDFLAASLAVGILLVAVRRMRTVPR